MMSRAAWNRIKAAFVPGVTATNALYTQYSTLDGAVRFYRFFGIARTARLETAGLPKKWAEQQSICFYKIQRYRLHRFIALCHKGCNLGRIASVVISAKGVLATTI